MENTYGYILDVMRLERLLKRVTNNWSGQSGLSLNELRILIYVLQNPARPIGAVAKALDVSKGSLAQSIGTLTQENWIQSEPVLPDRRLRCLTLTETGQARMATVAKELTASLQSPTAQEFTDQITYLNRKY